MKVERFKSCGGTGVKLTLGSGSKRPFVFVTSEKAYFELMQNFRDLLLKEIEENKKF